MPSLRKEISAVSRVIIAVIIVVILIVAGVGVYLATVTSTSSASTTSGSSSSSASSVSSSSSSSSSSSVSSISSSSSTNSTSSSSSSSNSSSPFHNTLVIDDANWPADDLNQLYAIYLLPWPNWLMGTVYQPLIGVNQTAQYQSGVIQYIPSLVQNWTVSNGTKYVFNLRNDVKFSDGNAFNAYQVWLEMYGWYYLNGNGSNFLEAYSLFDMSNVSFGPGTIAMINSSSGGVLNPSSQVLSLMKNQSWPIYVTGPYQIVFRLHAPFNYFLGTLVAYQGLMFDTQWLLQHGGFGNSSMFNSYFNQNPIPGSGPYDVTTVSEDNFVQFTQDPNYWGKGLSQADLAIQPMFDPGHAKTVVVNYKPDDLARYTDLSTGTSQVSLIESADWNLVQANSNKYNYFTMPPWNGEVLAVAINSAIFPTNNTLVRQAIVHAINYTDIAQKAFFGQLHPFVGPEYPAWSQFYDLGNLTPYQTNVTLAQHEMTMSGIKNFPTLTFTVITGCQYCITTAQIVQSDLAQIGITVTITIQQTAAYYSPYSTYDNELGSASSIGDLSMLGAEEWGPSTLTPADYWLSFVSNYSSYGNWAVYSNSSVDACARAFTSTSSVSAIQATCRTAQAQVYNDAPYAWLGLAGLWYAAGSLVWSKSVVKGFLVDTVWDGQSTAPIFNTLTFVS